MLSVHPERQRTRLASRLVAALEDHCREIACRFVHLHVGSVRPELPPFYRKLGYIPTGTHVWPPAWKPGLRAHSS